ncbi:MAG: pentapeptide repeat-containing protein, partial [Blastocatellia bacterium]
MSWRGDGLALEYRKNLNRIDLEGANLIGLDFSGMTLKSANLRGCNLSDAKFRSAFLEQTVLDEASIAEADFTGAELSDASFRRAKLGKVQFAHANAYDAHFDSADVIGCRFENAMLEGADFSRATLTAPVFSGAHLRFARFDGAIMSEPEGFLPDRTFSNAIGHATRPNDAWSILRRKYTGIRFALNLLLLIVFVLPYTARAIFWLGVHSVESPFIDERTGQLVIDLREEVEWLRSLSTQDRRKIFEPPRSDTLKSRIERSRLVLGRLASAGIPGASLVARNALAVVDKLDQLRERTGEDVLAEIQEWQEQARAVADSAEPFIRPWRPTPVWRLTLPGESALLFAILTTLQVLYQVLRGFLTVRVGTLRDEEILAGCSPAKAEYQQLAPLHRATSVLFYAAMVSLLIHSYLWLTKPVWFPS